MLIKIWRVSLTDTEATRQLAQQGKPYQWDIVANSLESAWAKWSKRLKYSLDSSQYDIRLERTESR